jgi:hypothetical protein
VNIFAGTFRAAVIAATALVAAQPAAAAQCNTIGGKGTAFSVEGAKFQAYEAMLQGTDWGMWAAWMLSGAQIGAAPGYRVQGLKFRCKAGAIESECRSRATFCKNP